MKYQAETPEEYLSAVGKENDWRSGHLERLCTLIKLTAPEVMEDVSSNVLRYSADGRVLCHVNAQKNHVGLYVGDVASIDIDGKLLKGVDVGKGCIRFKKSDDILNSGIVAFVEKLVALWRDGAEFEC